VFTQINRKTRRRIEKEKGEAEISEESWLLLH
jgi:hypothetical protein